MERLTVTEKVDVTVKLLVSHDFDEIRVGVCISAKKAKVHLQSCLSSLSPYQIRERSKELLQILESHVDSERLLQSLLKITVFQQQTTATLLRAAGVWTDDSFLTREELAYRIAR